jgi:hypothetical protein
MWSGANEPYDYCKRVIKFMKNIWLYSYKS